VRRAYQLTVAFCWEGGYLGEVIVRNIGGKLIYPSERKFEFYRHLRFLWIPSRFTIGILFKSCEVKLGDNLIPIMTIAQLRLDDKIPSLADVYERIRTTGKWESISSVEDSKKP
jgi:hypothetical protein